MAMWHSSRRWIVGIVLTMALLAAAGRGGTPVAGQGQGLEPRVSSLEALLGDLLRRVDVLETAYQPATISVDCTAGQTLFDGLQQALRRTGHVTIRMTGTCQALNNLTRSDLKLEGTAGAGLASLRVAGAQNVTIANVVLGGLQVVQNANVTILDSTITGNADFYGAFVDNAKLTIRNTIIRNNQRGVAALRGSDVRILDGSQVVDNQAAGVSVASNAVLQLDGGSRIAGNQVGISASFGAVVALNTATIVSNDTGVELRGHSTLVAGPIVIESNRGDGLRLYDASIAVAPGAAAAQIINNAGWGVHCSAPPATAQIAANGAAGLGTISGNALGQTDCPLSLPPQ